MSYPAASQENMASKSPVPQLVRETITARLCTEYPFMNVDAITTAAQACEQIIHKLIAAQATSLQANPSSTTFFSLSPELRNHVYELVLLNEEPSEYLAGNPIYIGPHTGTSTICPHLTDLEGFHDYCADCYHDLGKTSYLSKSPALLRTSRQVRTEASLIYYGVNSFYYHPHHHLTRVGGHSALRPEDFGYLQCWLERVGEQNAALIESMQILCLAEYFPDVTYEEVMACLFDTQYGLDKEVVRCFVSREGTYETVEVRPIKTMRRKLAEETERIRGLRIPVVDLTESP